MVPGGRAVNFRKFGSGYMAAAGKARESAST